MQIDICVGGVSQGGRESEMHDACVMCTEGQRHMYTYRYRYRYIHTYGQYSERETENYVYTERKAQIYV